MEVMRPFQTLGCRNYRFKGGPAIGSPCFYTSSRNAACAIMRITMEPNPSMSVNERLEALLEENLALSKNIYKSAEKTRHYILWGQILGWVKVLILVIPIIIGYIYLQPYIKDVFSTYQGLFGGGGSESTQQNTNSGIDPALLKKLQELQKSGKLDNLQQMLR